MATLPWTPGKELSTGTNAVALGSRLELRSYRHVPAFLVAAFRVRRQVRRSPGALGVSLIAHPIRRTFWTLSGWTDREALDNFVGKAPHNQVMERFHDRLADASFATWSLSPHELPTPRSNAKALWREAEHRLTARAEVVHRR
jgi:hypothetical protein